MWKQKSVPFHRSATLTNKSYPIYRKLLFRYLILLNLGQNQDICTRFHWIISRPQISQKYRVKIPIISDGWLWHYQLWWIVLIPYHPLSDILKSQSHYNRGIVKKVYRICFFYYSNFLPTKKCTQQLTLNINNIKTETNCNGIQTLKHLAKLANWLTCVVSTYLYIAFYCMFLSCHVCDWPIWLNSWVFVYKLSGCGFKFRFSHLNVRYYACSE